MWRTLGIAVLLLVTGATCFSQSTYKGLTPGTSTRAQAERVLGQPVKNVSATLIEYRPQTLTSKIYLQYRKDSPVIERIEFFCELEKSDCSDFFAQQNSAMTDDDWEGTVGDGLEKQSKYYRRPFYAVLTFANNKWVGWRSTAANCIRPQLGLPNLSETRAASAAALECKRTATSRRRLA